MLLFSMLTGRFRSAPRQNLKEVALEIFELITYRSRKVVFLGMAGLATTALACGGIFISLVDITTQYDQEGFMAWTATLSGGLFLTLASLAGLGYVYFRAWPGTQKMAEAREHQAEERFARKPPGPGSLEQALAALVMDYVKEREDRRASRSQSFHEETSHHRDRSSESESPRFH